MTDAIKTVQDPINMALPTEAYELPEAAESELAKLVLCRWNTAVRTKNMARVGDKNLLTVLNECYKLRYGIHDLPEDAQLYAELGADKYINLVQLKCDALEAWLRDLLTNSANLPFTIKPSSLPELSDIARQEVLQRVKQHIFDNPMLSSEDLLDVVRVLKAQVLKEEQDFSIEAAEKMTKLITKQCEFGNFRATQLKFIYEFTTYPFAVMHGPVPVQRSTYRWRGNRLKAV